MSYVLRCRNPRQIISNPNLAFILQYANKSNKMKDPKTVAAEIVETDKPQPGDKRAQRKPEDPLAAAQQIISDYPEEPTTCCMSGCANCVWLEYAEKISAYYRDGGEKAIKEINEKVDDPNIKAFLLHELRMKQKGS